MAKLTHLGRKGEARMVDVGAKPATERVARASAEVRMKPATLALLKAGDAKKGDVLGTARVAGIMAAKRASEWIPLCHPIALSQATVDFALDEKASRVRIETTARCTGPTGVEMEALTAAAAAALTIYDMLKAADREMVIGEVRLEEKRGGRSGVYRRKK
ncbi:MAG: cyclic pyranopterin monophosphate synthase MoaC [Candidatus Methylomirabilis sp.]|nr:cyclic pyranopterin monophosphate synthase MoaC [Deltaproteobacteria bacterium]